MQAEIEATLVAFRARVLSLFPEQASSGHAPAKKVAAMRETLLTIADVLAVKVPAMYESGRQDEMRPDRSCSVEVALLNDLVIVDHFVRDWHSHRLTFGHGRAVSPPRTSFTTYRHEKG